MKYVVEIAETLVKRIVVEADNENEAEIVAEAVYADEKVVLDYRDYSCTEIACIREVEADDLANYEDFSEN